MTLGARALAYAQELLRTAAELVDLGPVAEAHIRGSNATFEWPVLVDHQVDHLPEVPEVGEDKPIVGNGKLADQLERYQGRM